MVGALHQEMGPLPHLLGQGWPQGTVFREVGGWISFGFVQEGGLRGFRHARLCLLRAVCLPCGKLGPRPARGWWGMFRTLRAEGGGAGWPCC